MTQPVGLFFPCPLLLFGFRVRHQTSLLGNRSPDCRRRVGADDVWMGEGEDRRHTHTHTYMRETEQASCRDQRDGWARGEGRGGHMMSRWALTGCRVSFRRRAGRRAERAEGSLGRGDGGVRQHFSSPLPSQLRGIVVESAAALFHSALQTLGSEYCVARWGKPAKRKKQRQSDIIADAGKRHIYSLGNVEPKTGRIPAVSGEHGQPHT